MNTVGDASLSPVPLTDNTNTCVSDLTLTRISADEALCAWVEHGHRAQRVRWRAVRGGGLGPVHAIRPASGHVSKPAGCAGTLFWTEYRDACGTLLEMRLSADGQALEEPHAVAALEDSNVGEFAVAAGPNGARWLLAEAWRGSTAALRLLTAPGTGWHDAGVVGRPDAFQVRPRLALAADTVRASWDEYSGCRYRVCTASIGTGGCSETGSVPCPEGWQESLSALASDGRLWYVARCRERLVEFPGGAAGHHSELVLARGDGATWEDVASVNIDHAMNPWMAAYYGRRRFPTLVSDHDNGIWMLWEEKNDPESMDPCLGRLCGLAPGGDGNTASEPIVLVADRCMFSCEQQAGPGGVLRVATKTQWHAFESCLPYVLCSAELDRAGELRPAGLPTNACAPAFRVAPPRSTRSVHEATHMELFFGDPHLHSRFSKDLDGEQDELYHFARDVAELDFVAFTENDVTRFTEPLTDTDWELIRRNANAFNEPGRFSALVGWEYTLHENPAWPLSKHSHRCVLFPGSSGEMHPCYDERTPTPELLARTLSGQRVLLHHHHPMGYDITDDSVECNIEICSGWWNCMERPGFVEQVHQLLRRGLRLGFFGASDNHERNPGLGGALTGVWATANTREAIFEAFRQRRVFTTTGLRPEVRFSLNETFMGGVLETDDSPILKLSVSCDRAVAGVRFLRDGHIVHESLPDQRAVELAWTDQACPPGRHFYYAHIRFAGQTEPLPWNLAAAYGNDAWTSPIWVTRAPSR